MKEPAIIAPKGMGGFLNPPNHPEHSWHIMIDLNREKDDRGGMSLSYGLKCEWLSDTAKDEAKRKLEEWENVKPKLDSPEIVQWIHQVLGYYRNCYANTISLYVRKDGQAWDVGNCTIQDIDPFHPHNMVDEHCGVHFIRKFYPEYMPTKEDFANAYWGNKPVKIE